MLSKLVFIELLKNINFIKFTFLNPFTINKGFLELINYLIVISLIFKVELLKIDVMFIVSS